MLSLTASARPRGATRVPTMKLLMTLLVRNEAEMIEANLDYHLAQGVDFVIVTDHGSTDGTGELLDPYVREGVAAVLRDDADGHHQSRRVTGMARRALTEYAADWVFHNDADEFWWPLAGSLKDVFAAIPSDYGQIEVRRVNFLPSRLADEPFYSGMVYRETRSLNLEGEPLETKRAHRPHPDVTVAPGNHSISGAALNPSPIADMLEILHFPMRAYEQFERKVLQTGLGYEMLDDRSPDVGRDQLKLLEIQRRGGLCRYFEEALGDDDIRGQRLEEGSIVLDRRLESFMRELAEGREPAARAAGTSTRALVARALDVELQLQALHDELGSVRGELASTAALLQEVRGSRLMRATAPLRRLWYRFTHANIA